MVSERVSGQGFFGSYTAAVLPGLNVVEGGQTSTGAPLAGVGWCGARAAAQCGTQCARVPADPGGGPRLPH